MEGKTYALIFTMADGSEMRVEFTVPQGKNGDPGADGVGIQNITIREA